MAVQFFFFLHTENLFPMFLPQRIWNSRSRSRSWCKGGILWLLFSSHLWKTHSLFPDFSREICWIKSGSNTKGRREEEYFSYPHGTGIRVVQQTRINSPYLSPALNVWQEERGSQYSGRLGSSRGHRSSRAARAEPCAPRASSPPLPALLRNGIPGSFSLSLMPPVHSASTGLGWSRSTSASLAEHPGEDWEASLETAGDCFSPQWKIICEGLCPWGFQESSFTHPGTSPCYAEAKFQLGLSGGVWNSAPGKHTARTSPWNICWEAPVVTSKRGKSRVFSRCFSLPTSAGQEHASFHLKSKPFWSHVDPGFSHRDIPLKDGDTKHK